MNQLHCICEAEVRIENRQALSDRPLLTTASSKSLKMPSIDLSPVDIPPPTIFQEMRTSKLRQLGPVLSGIDKKLQHGQLYVSRLGLPDDEHDLTLKYHMEVMPS